MALYADTEFKVSEKGYATARQFCSKISTQTGRKRAFKALICMDTLADYLYSQGFRLDISKNLYKVYQINEEFEITDIHYNGRYIDVLPVVNGKYVLIPKIHFSNNILPDLYVVADYNQTAKKIKFPGCIEPENVDKTLQDEHYFIMEISQLDSPDKIEDLLNVAKIQDMTEKNHDIFGTFFIDYLDGNLAEENKSRLVKHLLECSSCRNTLIEFYDYEKIVTNTSKYPDLFEDKTLDIVGAAAVNDEKYKDFKEVTVEFDKEPDEYEEDEGNSVGEDNIHAADDPLQFLYSNNKNKEIFNLINSSAKKKSKGMLSDVMDEIEREQSPETHTISQYSESQKAGSINPAYYAEDLSEGFTDLVTPKSVFDKTEEEKSDNNNFLSNTETEETKAVDNVDDIFGNVYVPSEQTPAEDVPKFKEDLLSAQDEKMTANDEMLLLGTSFETDTPEFVAQIHSHEEETTDDVIVIEDDENETENDIQTIENTDIFASDDKVEIAPTTFEPQNSDYGFVENTTEDAENEDFIPESMVVSEEDLIYDEDNTQDYFPTDDNVLDENAFDEILIDDKTEYSAPDDLYSEEELLHIDAEDIDLVDEDDEEYFIISDDEPENHQPEKKTNIVKTIAETTAAAGAVIAGTAMTAAASQIAANADSVKNTVDTAKNISETLLNAADAILSPSQEASVSAKPVEDDVLVINDEDTKMSVSDIDDDMFVFGDENIAQNNMMYERQEKPTVNISDEDTLVIDDTEDELTVIDDEKPTANIPDTDDDTLVIDDTDDESTVIEDEKTTANISDEDTLVIDDTDDELPVIDNEKPTANISDNDEDTLVIDDTDEELTVINDEKPTANISDTDDDMLVIDDNDDDMVFIDDDEKPTPKISDNADDMLIIDDNDDDMVIIDDDDEKPAGILRTNISQEEDMLVFDEEEEPQKISNMEDIIADSANHANAENYSKQPAPQPSVPQQTTPVQSSVTQNTEEDEILELDGDAGDLFLDGSDDLLLEGDLEETPVETISDTVQQGDSDDLLYYDGDSIDSKNQTASNTVYEQEASDFEPIQSDNDYDLLNSNQDDDDLMIIDDDQPENSFVRPASVQTSEESDFIRPASMQDFNDNISDNSDDDMLIFDDEEENDNSLELQEEVDLNEQPEELSEEEQIDEETEEEPQEETKPAKAPSQLDLILGSMSQKEREEIEQVQNRSSASQEEKEEISPKTKSILDDITSQVNQEKEKEAEPTFAEEEKPVPTPPPTPHKKPIFREFKDAIAAKEEAVEAGKIDLTAEEEPVEEPAINSSGEEYEYVYVEDEDGELSEDEEYADDGQDFEETDEQEELEEYEDVDTTDEDDAYSEPIDDVEDFDGDINDSDTEEVGEDDETYEEDTDEEDEEETTKDNKNSKKTKIAIAAVLIGLIVLAGTGFALKATLFNKAKAPQTALETEANALDSNTENPADAGDTGNLEEGEDGGLALPEDMAPEPTAEQEQPKQDNEPAPAPQENKPKAGTENATTNDMDKAVANAFSDNPTALTVQKLSWSVNSTLAGDAGIKGYLQSTGKLIKSNIQKSLKDVKGVNPTSAMKIQLIMTSAGTLENAVIITSSGAGQLDETVLQSVKQTVQTCPMPPIPEDILQANEQASNDKNLKLTITIRF